LVLIAVLGISHRARAEAEEHRLGVAAAGTLVASEEAGAEASSFQGTFELQYSYGLGNWLSLGGTAFFGGGPRLTFDDALVESEGQLQAGQLGANMFAGGIGVLARAELNVDTSTLFALTHPYVAAGGGIVARSLSSQQLVDADGTPLFDVADSFELRPYAQLELGVERRLSAGFCAALAVGGRFAGSLFSSASARLELAWYWY